MAKIQVQGIGMFTDDTLRKKIIDLTKNLQKLAKKGEWSKSSENAIRALGRMWGAYQDWSRQNESITEGPDYDLAMKLNKIQTQIFKLGHQYKSKANVPAMMNSFMMGLTNQLKKSKLTEDIKKWKDIPKTGTLDFGKYGKYVINAKNKMFVLGRFISGSNKGKKVKWYSDDGKKDARRRKGLSISDTPSFPFGMVKESVDENMYDMSVFNLAVSHMGKFEKDFKRLIKSANAKDKKKALELMKVYKKHWIEFSVKVKDILKYD